MKSKFFLELNMQIIPVGQIEPDISDIPQINRFTDGEVYFVIETESDYQELPKSIKDMISASNGLAQ